MDPGAAAASTVPSYLGLSATVFTGADAFTAVLVKDGTAQEQVRTAVRIPRGPRGSVVLLAGVPGALVGLAADLAVTPGVLPGSVVLDADLELPDVERAHRELEDVVALNQAVGVLVARGCTVEEAHAELDRPGAAAGTSAAVAAQSLLGSLPRGGRPPG